jgi:hypothetical protein
MALTREQISSVLGPIDDVLAAEVLATSASLAELEAAFAWLNSDEALLNDHRPLPTGRVAQLIEILSGPDDEQ